MRDNVQVEGPEDYFRKSITVPFLGLIKWKQGLPTYTPEPLWGYCWFHLLLKILLHSWAPPMYVFSYSQLIKSNISSKPFYYYTGSHLGQILHSRLRMQCSSLNQHLYRKNIVDSPNCICGLTESTTHYLFHCRRYTAQRQMCTNSINVPINLTTEILLFGSPKLAPNQNVELFLAVQKCAICSKRFTP